MKNKKNQLLHNILLETIIEILLSGLLELLLLPELLGLESSLLELLLLPELLEVDRQRVNLAILVLVPGETRGARCCSGANCC